MRRKNNSGSNDSRIPNGFSHSRLPFADAWAKRNKNISFVSISWIDRLNMSIDIIFVDVLNECRMVFDEHRFARNEYSWKKHRASHFFTQFWVRIFHFEIVRDQEFPFGHRINSVNLQSNRTSVSTKHYLLLFNWNGYRVPPCHRLIIANKSENASS